MWANLFGKLEIYKESSTCCLLEISIKNDSSLNIIFKTNPSFHVTKGIVYVTCSDHVNTSYVFAVMDFSLAYNSAVYRIRTAAGRHTYLHIMLLTRGITMLINQHVSLLGVRKGNFLLKMLQWDLEQKIVNVIYMSQNNSISRYFHWFLLLVSYNSPKSL